MPDDIARTVVVTGGGKGIGEDITRAFADSGWRVVVGSRGAGSVAGDLGVDYVTCDVRDPGSIEELAEKAVAVSGCIDAWVNCAGYSEWRPIAEADEAFFDDMTATNLKGTYFGCKAAAARMERGGTIVNVASIAGRRGSANNSVYCATKFGVIGVTQSLAKELGPRGIRVNAVCPVYVATGGLVAALEDPRSPAGGGDVASYLSRFAEEQSALKRLPTGPEVAEVVLWLASDGASAITGQSLNVDCGVLPY